jgi:hypothetical protein
LNDRVDTLSYKKSMDALTIHHVERRRT